MKANMFAILLLLCASTASAQTAVTAFGDSITTGYGVNSGEAYPALIAADKGWTLTNRAQEGTQASDQAVRVFQQAITTSSKSILLTGYNDMRALGTNANGLDTYEGSIRAMMAWLATPAAKRINGQS
jgi:lysophospholipase L1-like esterase